MTHMPTVKNRNLPLIWPFFLICSWKPQKE